MLHVFAQGPTSGRGHVMDDRRDKRFFQMSGTVFVSGNVDSILK